METNNICLNSDRTNSLEKEQKELTIINRYLPEQMSEEESEKTMAKIINRTAAVKLKEIGKVMSEAMKILKGKADGKKVQQVARRKLA